MACIWQLWTDLDDPKALTKETSKNLVENLCEMIMGDKLILS